MCERKGGLNVWEFIEQYLGMFFLVESTSLEASSEALSFHYKGTCCIVVPIPDEESFWLLTKDTFQLLHDAHILGLS